MSSALKRALKLHANGKLHESLEVVNDELEYEDDLSQVDVKLLVLKAAIEKKLGQLDEAIETLNAAKKIEPTNPAIYQGYMAAYLAKKDFRNYFDIFVDYICVLASGKQDKSASTTAKTVYKQVFHQLMTLTKAGFEHNNKDVLSASFYFQDNMNLLAIPPLEHTDKKICKAHTFIFSDDSKVKVKVLKIVYHRVLNHRRIKIAAIEKRLKQSISYSQAKANEDMLNLYDNSDCLQILQLILAHEDDAGERRNYESIELDTLISILELTPQNSERRLATQKIIKSKVEDMMLFPAVNASAYELYWDYHMPDADALELVSKEAEKQSQNPKSKKKTRPRKKRNSDTKESHDTSTNNAIVEDVGTKLDKNLTSETALKPTTSKNVASSKDHGQAENEQSEVFDTSFSSTLDRYLEKFYNKSLAILIQTCLSNSATSGKMLSACTAYNDKSVYGYLLACRELSRMQAYQKLIDVAHKGLRFCKVRESVFGMDMSEAQLEINLILADCYIHYEAPKNYEIAYDIFSNIIKSAPNCIKAVVGKAFILLFRGDLDESETLLKQVIEEDETDKFAQSELGWIYIKRGRYSEGVDLIKKSIGGFNVPSRNAELNWRIGQAYWNQGMFDDSYKYFIESLREFNSYAPAFTSLGLFYKDVAHDVQRAQRCFFKAFELSNSEIEAARHLASVMADSGQWDLVEVVAQESVNAIKEKGIRDVDWPYRVMGIISLNQQNPDNAIKYFQASLRCNNADVQSWIGLGEAYVGTGKYNSATKCLNQALSLDPDNFSALYVLSLAQRQNGDYLGSAKSIRMALDKSPDFSVSLHYALVENSIRAAETHFSSSRVLNAFEELAVALKSCIAVMSHENTDVGYSGCTEVLMLLVRLGCTSIESLNVRYADEELSSDLLRVKNLINSESTSLLDIAQELSLKYLELAPKARKATAHYLVARVAYKRNDLPIAIENFQLAIKMEPLNHQFWNSYGLCIQYKNPAVAQHCFVRSLSLNGHDTQTWRNLSAFYLNVVNDIELAEEALNRCLSLDPSDSRAWILQALIAEVSDDNRSTNEQQLRTLEYALSLDGNDTLACYILALKEYNTISKPKGTTLGALGKLLNIEPSSKNATLLMGLLLERKGEYHEALTYLEKLEEQVHSSRVLLALSRFEEALESSSQIIVEEDTDMRIVISKLLTQGLANYYLNDFDSAIENFVDALNYDCDYREDILRLLVEVLYNSGIEEARQTAVDQLFENIQEQGATLKVTLLLGAVGLLSEDDAIIEASGMELRNFTNEIAELCGKELENACFLISRIEKSTNIYHRALFQKPLEYELWRKINKSQALTVAQVTDSDIPTICQALYESGDIQNCKRALFLSPGDVNARNALMKALKA